MSETGIEIEIEIETGKAREIGAGSPDEPSSEPGFDSVSSSGTDFCCGYGCDCDGQIRTETRSGHDGEATEAAKETGNEIAIETETGRATMTDPDPDPGPDPGLGLGPDPGADRPAVRTDGQPAGASARTGDGGRRSRRTR